MTVNCCKLYFLLLRLSTKSFIYNLFTKYLLQTLLGRHMGQSLHYVIIMYYTLPLYSATQCVIFVKIKILCHRILSKIYIKMNNKKTPNRFARKISYNASQLVYIYFYFCQQVMIFITLVRVKGKFSYFLYKRNSTTSSGITISKFSYNWLNIESKKLIWK